MVKRRAQDGPRLRGVCHRLRQQGAAGHGTPLVPNRRDEATCVVNNVGSWSGPHPPHPAPP